MMGCPVPLDPGHEQGIIAGLLEEGRLLKTRQVNHPGFMEELGEVQGSRIRPPALTSKKVLCHSVHHIIHPGPPIKRLHSLLSLMTPNPSPVDVNGKGFDPVMNGLKVVKARLGNRYSRGLGSLSEGCLTIKSNGKGTRSDLVVRDKEIHSG
jgi:hypothetical protein